MIKLNLPKNHLGIYYTCSDSEFIIWVIVPASSRYLYLEDGSFHKVKLPRMALGYEVSQLNHEIVAPVKFKFYSFIRNGEVLFDGPPNAEGGEICWGNVSSKIDFQNLEFEFWNSVSDYRLDEIEFHYKNGKKYFSPEEEDDDYESEILNLISKTGDQIQLSTTKISTRKISYDKDYYIRIKNRVKKK